MEDKNIDGDFIENAMLWTKLYNKCIGWGLIDKDREIHDPEYPCIEEMQKMIEDYGK